MLYSRSIMPPAERNATMIDRRETDAGGWCALPLWIVSQRVREVMKRRGFKGWGYQPVLETGTPLHHEYMRLWSEALERIAVNPRNLF